MSEQSALGPLRIIWGAMVGAVVLYTAVIFGLMASGALSVGTLPPGIMNIVGAAVMVYMGAVVFGRRVVVSRIAEEPDVDTRVARYRAVSIAILALMEGGGLIVITMGLLSNAPTWVLAGGGAAAALMFLAKPSEEEAGL